MRERVREAGSQAKGAGSFFTYSKHGAGSRRVDAMLRLTLPAPMIAMPPGGEPPALPLGAHGGGRVAA